VTDPEQVAAAMMYTDKASEHLGVTMLSVGRGRASAGLTVAPHHVNGHGMCHGGVLFLLADTAFGLACNSYGPETVGAAADIVYARGAELGDELVATAVERTTFGRSGVYDVTITRGEEIIAEFRGQSRTIGVVR
jgi:acyl-CoA thioesterase